MGSRLASPFTWKTEEVDNKLSLGGNHSCHQMNQHSAKILEFNKLNILQQSYAAAVTVIYKFVNYV